MIRFLKNLGIRIVKIIALYTFIVFLLQTGMAEFTSQGVEWHPLYVFFIAPFILIFAGLIHEYGFQQGRKSVEADKPPEISDKKG